MKKVIQCLVGLLVVGAVCSSVVDARKMPRQQRRASLPPEQPVTLPSGLVKTSPHALQAAAVETDTFILHQATFDGPGGVPDPMGYTTVDRTAQIAAFFHVADSMELSGGENGYMLPLSGERSMWCGQAPSIAAEFCSYETLPGYGNAWNQVLISSPLSGDSATITYKVFFDSEANYDGTTLEYTFDNGDNWHLVAVADTFGGRPDTYEGSMQEPYITESFSFGSAGAADVQFRFKFLSDGGWSDQDGLWPSDGAITIDDITVQTWTDGVADQSITETFETTPPGSNTAGIWTGIRGQSFGDFAALYEAGYLLQEDECEFHTSAVWGFFTDASVANYWCHQPDPRPDVGALPYGIPSEDRNDLWDNQIYLHNEIRSPLFPNAGRGDQYRLHFRVYRDLPLDGLVFYYWGIRAMVDGCPAQWRDFNYIYWGGYKDWLHATHEFGALVPPDADELQVRLIAIDMCGYWCGIYATLNCHSHAPLFDDVVVERVFRVGPEITVRELDLFQDTFAEDGTLTGTARADAAIDLNGYGLPIVPGDSVCAYVEGAAGDPHTGVGPAVYAYVALWPEDQAGKAPADMESPETRAGVGKRYPFIGKIQIGDLSWACYRMDSVTSLQDDRFCFDLNDALFTPGDTICYFFGADGDGVPDSGDEVYWHRLLNGQGAGNVADDIETAAASPCEFTILPAGGYNRGGDILYVDATDGRGGPAQVFFDNAFEQMGLLELVDRYDVLSPSTSRRSNGLGARVTNVAAQINDVYKIIIWSSGILSTGIGDGTSLGTSDDFGLLHEFLDTSNNDPGLYISGDDAAWGWSGLSGSADDVRSDFINHSVFRGDHAREGEMISPTLTASGSSFIHGGVPNRFVVYGGCPFIKQFDLITPTGNAIMEFPYPVTGVGAVISQETPNSAGALARVVLSGFGFESIRDLSTEYPRARAEHLSDILAKFGKLAPVASSVEPSRDYVNALEANYPNPFNPVTTIRYSIKERSHVSLKVYNTAGQLVTTLIDEVQSPDAIKPVQWHGTNNAGETVASGVYFYRLVTKGFTQTRKMVLLK